MLKKSARILCLYSKILLDSYGNSERTFHNFSMPLIYFPPLLDISILFRVIVLVKDYPELQLAYESLPPSSEDAQFFAQATSTSYSRLPFLVLRLSRLPSEKVVPFHQWPEA